MSRFANDSITIDVEITDKNCNTRSPWLRHIFKNLPLLAVRGMKTREIRWKNTSKAIRLKYLSNISPLFSFQTSRPCLKIILHIQKKIVGSNKIIIWKPYQLNEPTCSQTYVLFSNSLSSSFVFELAQIRILFSKSRIIWADCHKLLKIYRGSLFLQCYSYAYQLAYDLKW